MNLMRKQVVIAYICRKDICLMDIIELINKKIGIKATICAYIHWFLLCVLNVDSLFFVNNNTNKVYTISKILTLLFLICFYYLLLYVVREYKLGNERIKRCLNIFLIYFSINFSLLLILWPGTWQRDDIIVLWGATRYEINAWHHILTSYFDIVFAHILPFPGGIILIRILIASVSVSYIIQICEQKWKLFFSKKYEVVDILIKSIPFLMPTVVYYLCTGWRMGLYSFWEILLVSICLCAKEKENWTYRKLFIFAIIISFVSTWRTEGVIYLLVSIVPIINRKLELSKKFVFVIVLLCSFSAIYLYQNKSIGNNNYEVVATVSQCAELVRAADYEKDANDIHKIEKVLNISEIYENPEKIGCEIYWGGALVKKNYTKEDYRHYINGLISLIIKYPHVFVRERWDRVVDASNMKNEKNWTISQAYNLYRDIEEKHISYFREQKWVGNAPVFKNLREKVILILGCANEDFTIKPLYKIFWNPFITIILGFIGLVGLLIHKKRYEFIVCMFPMLKAFIVILTQPVGYLMYFLPASMFGMCVIVYSILFYCNKIKKDY